VVKSCNRCGERKPLDAFRQRQESPDGHTNTCKECLRGDDAAYRARYPELVKKRRREWARDNPEYDRLVQAERRNNSETKDAYKRHYAAHYPELMAKWAKRRADRLKATPPWFDAHKALAIYKQADRMRKAGFDVHVDHVLPLRGRAVCGLHVHTNLRIIKAAENLAKGNKVLDAKF
jgi:hypothetical protein